MLHVSPQQSQRWPFYCTFIFKIVQVQATKLSIRYIFIVHAIHLHDKTYSKEIHFVNCNISIVNYILFLVYTCLLYLVCLVFRVGNNTGWCISLIFYCFCPNKLHGCLLLGWSKKLVKKLTSFSENSAWNSKQCTEYKIAIDLKLSYLQCSNILTGCIDTLGSGDLSTTTYIGK